MPCGISSTSSSPARYCRANSLFAPTYEPVTRPIRPAASSTARPVSNAPQLLETTESPDTPRSNSASINTFGTPLNPNPPTASDAPSGTSDTASKAVATTLSMFITLPFTSADPSNPFL
ncbi:hypothetical protein SRB17_80130 [Streptomyces sp. RB17]|nr:hypothetical protein [Streptomyces sp. RB17]